MSFAILLGGGIPERDGQTWRLTVPAEWMQGRTSFGGWASAMALTVAKEFGRDLPSIGGEPVDELPPLRSAMINFIGPVFGEIEASARVLRQGRNAIWIGVELSQDDGLVFTATFLFRRPMESRISVSNLPAPGNVVHPDTMAGLFIDLEKPAFIRAFEICPVSHEPHDGRPEEKWWVRFKRREGMDPEVELLLVGDLTPPGFIRMMNPMAPLSSMT